jgi:hypothetical protein
MTVMAATCRFHRLACGRLEIRRRSRLCRTASNFPGQPAERELEPQPREQLRLTLDKVRAKVARRLQWPDE